MDPAQDSTYANRGLCYLNLHKYSQAKSDLTKAITINSRNIKALKRLAQCHLYLGELSESEMYLKRCVDVEPNEPSHKIDVKLVKDLIISNEELRKAKFIYDYNKSEKLAEKLVNKCTEATDIKLIYVECLIKNNKPSQALTYLKTKVSDEELRKEEFQYLLAQAYFYEGK